MAGVLNTVSLVSLGGTAAATLVAVVLGFIIGKRNSRVDRWVIVWLLWDAMIHFVLEGSFVYFSLNGTVEKSNHFMAETWKEYAKADKRWAVFDPTIVAMEILTVVLDGCLCLWLIHAIVSDKYYRHWVQLVLCVCELYGGWMTYAPDWLMGSPNLVTDNWLYMWVYLVFFNGVWVVIPLALMYQSWQALKQLSQGRSHKTGPAGEGHYNLRSKKSR